MFEMLAFRFVAVHSVTHRSTPTFLCIGLGRMVTGLPSCTPTGEYSQSGQLHSITSVSVLFTTHPSGNRLLQGEQAPVLSFGAVKCHLPTHCSTKLETPLSEVDFGLSCSFFRRCNLFGYLLTIFISANFASVGTPDMVGFGRMQPAYFSFTKVPCPQVERSPVKRFSITELYVLVVSSRIEKNVVVSLELKQLIYFSAKF